MSIKLNILTIMRSLVLVKAFACATLTAATSFADSPTWTGDGKYRLLIEVDPIAIGSRTFDERPAQLNINWETALQSSLGISGKKADMNSIQVIQYDRNTGQPMGNGGWAFGKSATDRAFRWYDNAIPNPYPESESLLDLGS